MRPIWYVTYCVSIVADRVMAWLGQVADNFHFVTKDVRGQPRGRGGAMETVIGDNPHDARPHGIDRDRIGFTIVINKR
jgi:hypothetical protein